MSLDSAMHGYRAYIMGRDGHIQDRIEFFCDSDDAAKERAKQLLVNGYAVELWDEGRNIAVYEPEH
jgi:hypothetical protein